MRTRCVFAAALVAVLAAPAARAYEVAPVPDGGSLRGVVRFAGSPPRLEPLAVNKNRDVCGDTKEPRSITREVTIAPSATATLDFELT